MDKGNSFEFQGRKLKLAREMNLLTISTLGEELEVSHQLISAWENGKKTPTFDKVLQLSNILGVARSFFFIAPPADQLDNDIGFFRKGAAVANKYQVQVKNIALYYSYIVEAIEKKISLPKFSLPEFAIKNSDFLQIDYSDIEEVTYLLRSELGLGNGPISNMTLLAEKLGVRVHFQDLSSAKIDALTSYINDTPYIVINNSRISSVRIRFNIAHELGHILLHSKYKKSEIGNSSNNKRIESEANYFAGSLLLPEDGFSLDLSSTNMNHLIELKKHWKVSIQALIYRGEQINLISSQQALFLRQTISRNRWRFLEPYDDEIQIEYPSLLNKAISFLETENTNAIKDISLEVGLEMESIKKLLNYVPTKKEVSKPKLTLL